MDFLDTANPDNKNLNEKRDSLTAEQTVTGNNLDRKVDGTLNIEACEIVDCSKEAPFVDNLADMLPPQPSHNPPFPPQDAITNKKEKDADIISVSHKNKSDNDEQQALSNVDQTKTTSHKEGKISNFFMPMNPSLKYMRMFNGNIVLLENSVPVLVVEEEKALDSHEFQIKDSVICSTQIVPSSVQIQNYWSVTK
mmetsp:Transcript_34386/g.79501  ORF Transcript_34386/g.79501 Transcript_34386/m.79501 type:complete len:195 (+) Transcript_34386:803-1387(+)